MTTKEDSRKLASIMLAGPELLVAAESAISFLTLNFEAFKDKAHVAIVLDQLLLSVAAAKGAIETNEHRWNGAIL